MLRPSYSELMEILNQDIDLNSQITSRYTIVIAAAKRARQIINGAHFDGDGATTDKAVSIAVNEMSKGEIKIIPDGLHLDIEPEVYIDPEEAYSQKIAESLGESYSDPFDDEIVEEYIDDDYNADDFDNNEDKE